MHLCVHVGHLRACGPARLAPSRWVSRGREVPSAAALGAPGFTVAWGRVPLRGRVLWLTPLRARAASGGFRLGSCLDENGRPSGPAPCGPDPLAALGSASRTEGGGRRLCQPARQAASVGAAVAASSWLFEGAASAAMGARGKFRSRPRPLPHELGALAPPHEARFFVGAASAAMGARGKFRSRPRPLPHQLGAPAPPHEARFFVGAASAAMGARDKPRSRPRPLPHELGALAPRTKRAFFVGAASAAMGARDKPRSRPRPLPHQLGALAPPHEARFFVGAASAAMGARGKPRSRPRPLPHEPHEAL